MPLTIPTGRPWPNHWLSYKLGLGFYIGLSSSFSTWVKDRDVRVYSKCSFPPRISTLSKPPALISSDTSSPPPSSPVEHREQRE